MIENFRKSHKYIHIYIVDKNRERMYPTVPQLSLQVNSICNLQKKYDSVDSVGLSSSTVLSIRMTMIGEMLFRKLLWQFFEI